MTNEEITQDYQTNYYNGICVNCVYETTPLIKDPFLVRECDDCKKDYSHYGIDTPLSEQSTDQEKRFFNPK